MVDFVSFGVIIDDIVEPSGQTRMGVLGGGGPQTVFGMRLWSESIGLVAGVGRDYFDEIKNWLKAGDIDDNGIRVSDAGTPRAWQLMEEDGRRRQVFRVSQSIIQEQLCRSIELIPDSYMTAKGFHFGIHPNDVDIEFIESLKKLNTVVSIEPFKPAEETLSERELSDMLRYVDIFSANLEEAKSLIREDNLQKLGQSFLEFGPLVVVLRMGEKGSLLFSSDENSGIHIPSVNVTVVDPVGAGNAYCGGFLVGWIKTKNLSHAGIDGSVSASFLLEQYGVPIIGSKIKDRARERFASLENQIK